MDSIMLLTVMTILVILDICGYIIWVETAKPIDIKWYEKVIPFAWMFNSEKK